jgi:uncharacterized damage-inducible protein DinB
VSEAAAIRARLPHHLTVLRRNLELLERMVDGVNEAWADRELFPGGSTLRWLLGHLIDTRDLMLRQLQSDPVLDPRWRERYARGTSATRTPGEPPLATMVALLHRQQERLERAFAAADEETLAAQSGDRTLGDELEFLVWHDTYHIGQATLYRRASGLASPIG